MSLHLYLAELLSLNLYVIFLSFVMLLLNSVCPPIQQTRHIDVSIREFQKTFESSNSHDVSCHVYHFMEKLTEATAKWELKKSL